MNLVEPQQLSTCSSNRLSLPELQKTLPDGWAAFETLDGRYFFKYEDRLGLKYEHPNADLEAGLYAPAPELCDGGLQLKYEALSYVWGPAGNPVTIDIYNGGLGTQPRWTLQIGQNLALALRHLRDANRSRALWVDALSINQGDIAERNRQVMRMASIYRLADSVIVWLGPAAEKSHQAISALEYLAAQVEVATDYTICRANGAKKMDWADPTSNIPNDEGTWEAIAALFRRPYFKRVWVMQEFRLASKQAVVRCGNNEMLHNNFRKAIGVLWAMRNLPDKLEELVSSVNELTFRKHIMTLGDLLSGLRLRGCADQRDKVYGILALAPPNFSSRVLVDYSRPTAQLYQDVMLLHTELTSRLDFLPECALHKWHKNQFHLPSWVPDWSNGVESVVSLGTMCQAAGLSRATIRHYPPSILEVTGVVATTISWVSKQFLSHGYTIEVLKSCEPNNLLTDTYPTGQSLLDAWLRLLLYDRVRDRFPLSEWPKIPELRNAALEKITRGSSTLDTGIISLEHFDRNLFAARLLRTEGGYFGFGVHAAEPGTLESRFQLSH